MSLVIENLFIRFGGLTAINNLSMEIKDGEILALIGPNGAGKSTLINAITGFVDVSEGSIVYNGKNITNMEPYQINNEGIIRTFQMVQVFSELTVLENVVVGTHRYCKKKKCAIEEAKRILDIVGLRGYDDYRASELTLARQKHLELARAMATRPKLLLLDELVTGLTTEEITEMIEILQSIRKEHNLSIMFIEHIMDAVTRLAERVVVINFGSLLAEGDVRDIMKNPDVIEAYLGGDDYAVKG